MPPDQIPVFEKCLEAARRGDADAQFRLGVMYVTGAEGLTQDLPAAAQWYRRAAAQGHRFAAHNLAVMLLNGDGVAPDAVAAFGWSSKAAEQDVPEAQLMLGNLYVGGLGTAADLGLARHWYQKAVTGGNALAAANLRALDQARQGASPAADPGKVPPRFTRRVTDTDAAPVLDHAKRETISSSFVHKAVEAQKIIAFAEAMTGTVSRENMRLLLLAYVNGTCSHEELLQHNLRAIINKIAAHSGFVTAGKSVIDHWFDVDMDVLGSLCPELMSTVFSVRSNAGLEEIPLLEPSPNELVDRDLPAPMNMWLAWPERPAVRAYATEDAVLYVDPFRYQVLSNDRTALWASASPRRLSRAALGRPEVVEVDRDIVVLQDRFNFTNLSHFLFDGISRVLLLHRRLGTLHNTLLVFGGIPGDYHQAICAALTRTLGLSADAVFFPERPVMLETRRRLIWFSDQLEHTLFPAQMAHPVSIDLLRSIVEAVPAETSPPKRLYISRADAVRRRVRNEAEVLAALRRRGFEEIVLSGLPARQQIGLFRGAELVVGPHGMGLTHVIAADRLRGVVELFHPDSGTDTYAFISKAGRIQYDWITGVAIDSPDSDFEIAPAGIARINQAIDAAETNDRGPSWRKPANLLPGSRRFSGFKAASDAIALAPAVPELIWGNAVLPHRAHRRSPDETMMGEWPGIRVIPGIRYTASCWVWISDRFPGTDVVLELDPCSDRRAVAADLTNRQTWQRISVTGTAASDVCAARLRVTAPEDAQLYSTCWQLEQGDTPGPYVETQ